MINEQGEDLFKEALLTLQALARVGPELYLEPIRECKQYLQEPQNKQAKAASTILKYLGRGSPEAFQIILEVIPSLMSKYQAGDMAMKAAVCEAFAQILDGQSGPLDDTQGKPRGKIEGNSLQGLFYLLIQALGTPDEYLRLKALQCLRTCSRNGFCALSESKELVHTLNAIILAGAGKAFLDSSIDGLREISTGDPTLIESSFPLFIAAGGFPLEALARIANVHTSETLIPRLFDELAVGPSDTVLAALHHLLSKDANAHRYHEKILRLIAYSHHWNDSSLRMLGRLAILTSRHADLEKQQQIGDVIASFDSRSILTCYLLAAIDRQVRTLCMWLC